MLTGSAINIPPYHLGKSVPLWALTAWGSGGGCGLSCEGNIFTYLVYNFLPLVFFFFFFLKLCNEYFLVGP